MAPDSLDSNSHPPGGTVQPAADRDDATKLRLGLTLALASAASWGVITTFARLAYDAGTTPWVVTEVRFLGGALVLFLICKIMRRPIGLQGRSLWSVVGMALGVLCLTLFYLSSVAFIPVSLAALIFYTFPLMVAALAPVTEGRRLSPGQALAFLAAFCGLALALGPSFEGLDWRGLILAFAGAFSAAALFVISGRSLPGRDALAVTLQVNLIGALLMTLLLPLVGAFPLPQTPGGWGGLTAASFCYILAVFTQFVALGYCGASRAALVFNLEPLVSIGCAVLLLGERLSLLQTAGVGLVLTALALSGRPSRTA